MSIDVNFYYTNEIYGLYRVNVHEIAVLNSTHIAIWNWTNDVQITSLNNPLTFVIWAKIDNVRWLALIPQWKSADEACSSIYARLQDVSKIILAGLKIAKHNKLPFCYIGKIWMGWPEIRQLPENLHPWRLDHVITSLKLGNCYDLCNVW